MLELDNLIRQVLKNCDISDSQNAGLYSVCGLALRLRDLYKWEKGLNPWEERDSSAVLEWIGDKEQTWDQIAEKEFLELAILDNAYDPFNTSRINALLEPHGFFYGAGYAHSLKPTFFLAPIEDKERINEFTVITLGRELARDLLTIPALSQDNCILLRRESGTFFLWDQIFYIKKSGRPALGFALETCGINDLDPKALKHSLPAIYRIQRETYIYHEIGEIRDTVFDADIWRQLIAAFPHTPVEILARAVKDLLADTNKYGTLHYITKERKTALLGFYVAFIDGMIKALFPELRLAFSDFTKTRNWQGIEQAVSIGYENARRYAEEIIDIFRTGKQNKDMKWIQYQIEKRVLPKVNSAPKTP